MEWLSVSKREVQIMEHLVKVPVVSDILCHETQWADVTCLLTTAAYYEQGN